MIEGAILDFLLIRLMSYKMELECFFFKFFYIFGYINFVYDMQ